MQSTQVFLSQEPSFPKFTLLPTDGGRHFLRGIILSTPANNAQFEFTIPNQGEYYSTQAVLATFKERHHLIQPFQTEDFTDSSFSLMLSLGLAQFQAVRCQDCIVIDMLAKHCLEFHISISVLVRQIYIDFIFQSVRIYSSQHIFFNNKI